MFKDLAERKHQQSTENIEHRVENRDSHQTGSLLKEGRSQYHFYKAENRQPHGSPYEVEGKMDKRGSLGISVCTD
jgi:hypothetical protein